MTSNAFKKTMDDMVLGVDYFQDEIVITNKRVESDSNDSIHENYFFIITMGMYMIIISECKCRQRYIENMKLEMKSQPIQRITRIIHTKNMGFCLKMIS